MKVLERLQQMTVNELDAFRARRWLAGAGSATFSAQGPRSLATPLNLEPTFSFACDPVGLRLRRAQLCAAQASPPSFFVFPRSVRALLSVVQPGLYRNLA